MFGKFCILTALSCILMQTGLSSSEASQFDSASPLAGTVCDKKLDLCASSEGIAAARKGASTSTGNWPEYSGRWKSLGQAAGSKYKNWAYLAVKIKSDGRFSGFYKNYVYSYTWNMMTAWGNIPIPVYVPASSSRPIKGNINFETNSGTARFGGKKVGFSLEIISDKQLALVFPSGFRYSVANIQR